MQEEPCPLVAAYDAHQVRVRALLDLARQHGWPLVFWNAKKDWCAGSTLWGYAATGANDELLSHLEGCLRLGYYRPFVVGGLTKEDLL